MSTSRLRLGQLLVDAKLLSPEVLEESLQAQRTDGRRLGTLLVERGHINETQLTQILSHQLSVPWVSLLHIEFSRQLLNLVPHNVADQFCLVPIYVRHVRNQGDTLYVAMDDPTNEDGLRACREHSGLPVRAMIAPPNDIRNALRVYYGIEPTPPPRPPETAPASVPDPEPSTLEVAHARELVSESSPTLEVAPAPELTEELAFGPAPVPEASPTLEVAPAPELAEDLALEPAPATPPPEAVATQREPALRAVAFHEAPDGPDIEAVEIPFNLARAERLSSILEPPVTPVPPSDVETEDIPRPRGRAPRMVSLTLLDGTTITLPAKPAKRRSRSTPPSEGERSAEAIQGLTARDLVLALRVVARGADATEVLGDDVRWESLFAALLAVLLKKHIIADWEFVDELKKNL